MDSQVIYSCESGINPWCTHIATNMVYIDGHTVKACPGCTTLLEVKNAGTYVLPIGSQRQASGMCAADATSSVTLNALHFDVFCPTQDDAKQLAQEFAHTLAPTGAFYSWQVWNVFMAGDGHFKVWCKLVQDEPQIRVEKPRDAQGFIVFKVYIENRDLARRALLDQYRNIQITKMTYEFGAWVVTCEQYVVSQETFEGVIETVDVQLEKTMDKMPKHRPDQSESRPLYCGLYKDEECVYDVWPDDCAGCHYNENERESE